MVVWCSLWCCGVAVLAFESVRCCYYYYCHIGVALVECGDICAETYSDLLIYNDTVYYVYP